MTSRRSRLNRGESLTGYAFIAPNMVLLTVFVLVPLVWAVVISFQQTNGFGAGRFVGLDNYTRCSGARPSTPCSSR